MSETFVRDTIEKLFFAQLKTVENCVTTLDFDSVVCVLKELISSDGSILTSGVGKSSYIAKKLSKMLVSYGIQSQFLSPMNSIHGDLGSVKAKDYCFLFSKSGNTSELIALIPHLRFKKCLVVAVTCSKLSKLSAESDYHIYLPLDQENCPLGISPVSSSVLQLLFADTFASAIASIQRIDEFTYKKNHPSGDIGIRMACAADLMRKAADCPCTGRSSSILVAVQQLCSKGCAIS